MPPQEVGVRAIFDTSNFSTGLAAYTRGLKRAVDRTNDATTALNSMAAAFNNAFTGTQAQVAATTGAIRQMTQAANAATRARQRVASAQAPGTNTAGLDRELEITRLLKEELKDRVGLVKANEQAHASTATTLQRELALIEQQTIQLRQQKRAIQLSDLGAFDRLLNLRGATPERADSPAKLGIEGALQRELDLNRLVQAELKERISLVKAIDAAQDASLTAVARHNAELAVGNLLLQRQRRLAEFVRLGGDPRRLAEVNNLTIVSTDLNKQANEALLRQVEAQRLIQAEISDRIELERISLILADRHASTLQRQAALARQQTIEANRQIRSARANELGIPAAKIADIRNATVATRDLGNAMQRAAGQGQGLNVAAVALGTTLSTMVTTGIGAVIRGVRSMGGTVLENIEFFERMNLSIGFFVARSMGASTAALNYSEKIAIAAKETEGLMQWLTKIAIASPFTTKDVATLFRTSQAYGLLREEAEVLTPLLVDFAAAAGLDRDILERLALAIGQVRSRGKLTGEEIRQLGNSGLPIRDILVKTLNIANEEFDELVESGAITSNIAIPAIIKALKDFEGAGEAVAFGTIGGLVSAFKDLQEVATSRFMLKALEPLKESFVEFFEFANSPQVLATIQVLGELVGEKLAAGFEKLRASVEGAIKAWNDLDPVVKQEVVTFIGAAAVILGVAAAFGLMVLAVNLLSQPLVAITLLGAAFVAEWSFGWQTVRKVTASAVSFVGNLLNSLTNYGAEVAASWGRGLADFGNVVADFVGVISSALTFWLAPGSPPRVAPDIDKWGKATAQEYLNAYAEANAETPLNKLGQVVERELVNNTIKIAKASVEMLQRGQVDATVNMARILNAATRKSYGVVVKTTKEVLGGSGAQAAAEEAGIRVSEAYINGFGHMIRKLRPLIDPELQEAVRLLGGGEQLRVAGANAFTRFLSGFKQGDFGVLDEISGVIESFLQGLVDRGQISEGEMLTGLFAAREDIAAALQEFRKFGNISERTLAQITEASGEAGSNVRDMLVAYVEFAKADDILTSAQKRLTDVTKQYESVLRPLRRELERISGLRQTSDEEQEIASLRRLIANEAVSEFRKSNARLKIEEILQGRKVRGLEAEQQAKTEVIQTEIDAASERQQNAQLELDLVKARIEAQVQQLSLVNQEAQLMAKLREEIEKLQEKQKTPLDLQSELLKLQQAELADLAKAAKAKYTLDQADSSELERQQAILDLMEVSLARQQRLVEARELGIPEEELTKLYNFEVTLDDIGVKTKKDFGDLGGALDGITQSTVNAKLEAEKWTRELEKARKKIEEVKLGLHNMFMEINTHLPDWLKIFPEKEGTKPPILETLEKYRLGILSLAGVILATRILALLGGISFFFAAMGGASAAGNAGTAGRAAAGLRLIGSALWWVTAFAVRFLNPWLLLAGAIAGVVESWEKLKELEFRNPFVKDAEGKRGKGVEMIQGFLGIDDNEPPPDPLAQVKVPTEQDTQPMVTTVADVIRTAYEKAVAQGLSQVDVGKEMVASFNEGLATGIVPDDANVRAAAVEYMNVLLEAYKTAGEMKSPSELSKRELGVPFGEGILLGILQSFQAAGGLNVQIAGALGKLRDGIKTIFDAIHGNTTRKMGQTKDEVLLDVDALSSAWKLNSALLHTALLTRYTDIKTDVSEKVDELRRDVSTDFTQLKTQMTDESALASTAVTEAFMEMKTSALEQVGLLKTGVMAVFAGGENTPGLATLIEYALMGRDGLRSYNIGANFMKLMAAGITSQQQIVADAMSNAFVYSLAQAQASIPPSGSPGVRGLPAVDAQFGARPSAIYPGGTTVINNNKYYYLTVQTTANSQGVAADFGIMQTLAPD